MYILLFSLGLCLGSFYDYLTTSFDLSIQVVEVKGERAVDSFSTNDDGDVVVLNFELGGHQGGKGETGDGSEGAAEEVSHRYSGD